MLPHGLGVPGCFAKATKDDHHSGLNSPIVTSNDETTAATPQRIDLAELEDLRSHWKINCTDQHADRLFHNGLEPQRGDNG